MLRKTEYADLPPNVYAHRRGKDGRMRYRVQMVRSGRLLRSRLFDDPEDAAEYADLVRGPVGPGAYRYRALAKLNTLLERQRIAMGEAIALIQSGFPTVAAKRLEAMLELAND